MNTYYMAGMLMVLIALAGCTVPGTQNGTDEPPLPDKRIVVDGPRCTVEGEPCSSAGLTRYSLPKVSIELTNDGDAPITMDLSTGLRQGRELMQTLCDTYGIKEFRAQQFTDAGQVNVANRRQVTLEPGDQLGAEWFLTVLDASKLDNGTVICLANFGLSFEQELRTVKQVQIRANRDIPLAGGLEGFTTSESPVELVIDAPDTMLYERIGGEVKPLVATAYVADRGSGTITRVGSGSGQAIQLRADGIPDRECSPAQVSAGVNGSADDSGIACRFTPPQVATSQIFDLVAESSYAYEMDLSSVEIRLAPLEVS